MRSVLHEDIKEKLTQEAKYQIVRFFQQSKARHIKDKYRDILSGVDSSSKKRGKRQLNLSDLNSSDLSKDEEGGDVSAGTSSNNTD